MHSLLLGFAQYVSCIISYIRYQDILVPEGPGDSELLFRFSPRGVAPLVMYRYMWVVTAGQAAQLVLGVEDGRCFINPFFCHHICPTFVRKHRLPRMFPDLNDTGITTARSLLWLFSTLPQ